MKVKEIYENALALNISRMEEEEDMEFFAIKLFNILLAETRAYNNQMRIYKGKKPLDAVKVTSLEDEMPYEDEFYAPLSYGLASKLLGAQEEINLAALYNNQYVTLLDMTVPAVEVEVE